MLGTLRRSRAELATISSMAGAVRHCGHNSDVAVRHSGPQSGTITRYTSLNIDNFSGVVHVRYVLTGHELKNAPTAKLHG